MEGKMIIPPIVYSCYFNASRKGEDFVPVHLFSYQMSGTITINDGQRKYRFDEGAFRFVKRNLLAGYTKSPSADGEFKSLAIRFDQEILRAFSREYGYVPAKKYTGDPVVHLPEAPQYKAFMESLLPYYETGKEPDPQLMELKMKEALLILLKVNPELKDILFDFSEPGKIELEEFMEKNYRFRVGMDRFAYMSGRSLATFKRDFQKTFGMAPGRWLLKRRLQEAYFQITEKNRKPSDVYLELGFEDLSHFTFAFRKAYGVTPSKAV